MEKPEDVFLYSRVGMALLSSQRVEFITGQLLEILTEFDKDVYGITSPEFFTSSQKSKKDRKTLGAIFKLLKLNPKLVIEEDLNRYVKMRNVLAHGFWTEFLQTDSPEQTKKAINFCYEFGRLSNKLESFFLGFLYFLSLRHVEHLDDLPDNMKEYEKDFEFFMESNMKNASKLKKDY